MSNATRSVPCTAFERRLVVCSEEGREQGCLKTVEFYDSYSDKWERMQNMINCQVLHGLIAARRKLFVIRFIFCEVFDRKIGKFVAIKSPVVLRLNKALMIGSKTKMFRNRTEVVLCYDVG